MMAILLKEFRSYLRLGRPFLTLTIYLGLMSGLLWLIYAGNVSSSFVNRASLGQSMFATVIGFAVLQLVFLSPGLNASSLGLERDRQTIDLLMIAPISALKLILGKMSAPILYLILMSLAVLPLASLAFFIGGIEVVDVLFCLWMLLLTIFGYGTIGIWAASRSASSRNGLLIAQGLSIIVAIILPILIAITAAVVGNMSSGFAQWLVTSPLIRWPVLILLSLSPFVVMIAWLALVVDGSGNIWTMDMPSELGGGTIPSLWIISTVVWFIVIPFLIYRSSKRLPHSVAMQGGG